MWNQDVRQYFFTASPDDAEADHLFTERYCSDRTLENIQRNGVQITELRRVLNRLAELVPCLEHSTPKKHSSDRPAQLLVVIGRAHLKSGVGNPVPVIRQPRFGLCAFNNQIHIWTHNWAPDVANQEEPPYPLFDSNQWAPWPGREGKCYLTVPVSGLLNQNIGDPLGEGTPLKYFVEMVRDRLAPPDDDFHEAFNDRRVELGVEEYAVGYPKLCG